MDSSWARLLRSRSTQRNEADTVRRPPTPTCNVSCLASDRFSMVLLSQIKCGGTTFPYEQLEQANENSKVQEVDLDTTVYNM